MYTNLIIKQKFKSLKSFKGIIFRRYKSAFYVTTPIYYVNAGPHIGHLYSSLIADAVQRWQKLLEPNRIIKFSTGTDEHGLKIQRAASDNKTTIPEYCTKISQQYLNLSKTFSVNYTDFIRTTDRNHIETVSKFWTLLKDKDLIYSSKYEGWYCASDETFLSQSQLLEKKDNSNKTILVSKESGHSVEWSEELNYIFRLSSFRDDLKYWLKNNPNAIQPKKFHKILYDLVESENLADISVSRPTSRVHWGIKVPGDENQTIYVWLDALVNYLTACKFNEPEFNKTWPPDVQVIGKDILKFHGIYWPAFLIAANLEPPRTILCHSHWTVDDEKMSKSKNNVICPFNQIDTYSAEGLRYFLLREGVAHSDGNYSDVKVIRTLNSELADTLGNLLSRCTGKVINVNQEVPEIDNQTLNEILSLEVTKNLIEKVTELPDLCEKHYNEFNFYKVVDCVVNTLHSGNLFFEHLKPWELRKNNKLDELNVVLHITIETLRVSAVLLQPIIPNLMESMLNKISVDFSQRSFDSVKNLSWNDDTFQGRRIASSKTVFFKRIITDKRKLCVS